MKETIRGERASVLGKREQRRPLLPSEKKKKGFFTPGEGRREEKPDVCLEPLVQTGGDQRFLE